MSQFWIDIRAHRAGSLAFLGYWAAAWGMDAALALSQHGHVAGERSGGILVLNCLLAPLLAAAVVAWWRAGRRCVVGGIIAAVLVSEANLAVIFCEDADISSEILRARTWLDLFIAASIFAAAGAVMGIAAASGAVSLRADPRFDMTATLRKGLFWAPRALCIGFTLLISSFALDVFGPGRGFWETFVALNMHLIPSYTLVGMLILAWRWEWIGAVVPTALGLLFLWWDGTHRHNAPSDVLMIAGPLFLMAVLFLANWLKRDELHPR